MLAASFTMLRCTISNTSLIFDSNTTQILNQLTDSSCCHLFLFWLWRHSRLAQILPLSEITADNSGPWSDSNPIVIQCLTKTELANWINPGSIRSYNPARQKCAYTLQSERKRTRAENHLRLKQNKSSFAGYLKAANRYIGVTTCRLHYQVNWYAGVPPTV